jgi:hypothetical protein
MLYDPHLVSLRVRIDRKRPSVSITPFPRSGGLRTVRGKARDTGGSGLAEVRVALVYAVAKKNCRHYDGKTFVKAPCTKRIFFTASGRASWHVTLPRKITGAVAVFARAIDRAGNSSATRKRLGLVRR